MLATSGIKQKAKKNKLKILEIAGPKSFQHSTEHKVCQDNDLHIPSCLHGADESQTSTRQIKKVCQHSDLQTPSGLHNVDKSQNEQPLGEDYDHLDNSFKE